MIGLQDVDLWGRGPHAAGGRSAMALAGLTFRVPTGGFRWIEGRTGSGKSALIRLLAGRIAPDRGRLSLFGIDPARLGESARACLRRRIGVVDEDRRLVPHLSVLDNVALPLRIGGMAAAAALLDATEMLHWVGLGGALDRRADTLSRGERLACALARAVVGRPELLLADEPAAELGESDGGRLFQLLLEMNRLGATVLVATSSTWLRRLHDAPALRLEAGRLAAA